jgi:hypothetical protein
MRKLRGTRPSPAMIVAIVALVAALGGTAWAAKKINGGSIVKQSIGGGKLKKNTLSGFQIKASKLGTVATAKRATHTYWAVVNNPSGAGNATLARASDAGIGVVETGGRVVVTFGAAVGACADVAGKNNTGTTVPGTGYAQTNVAPSNGAALEVRTYNETGAPVDGDFHLILICP